MHNNKLLNKYYTKYEVASNCIDIIKNTVHNFDKLKWIEPSAGSGAFVRDFTDIAYDIAPEAEGIVQSNWFDVTLPNVPFGVYGNPPWADRNNLTKQFIKKAIDSEHCKVVSFLLPAVFDKYTLQSIFPTEWKLIAKHYPGKESFTFEGNDYSIPCVFQIWEKDSTLPDLRETKRSVFNNDHFEIVKNNIEADCFVMGAAPNTVKLPCQVTTNNRGYWLKSKINFDKLIDLLKLTKYNGLSSAAGGVFWLTKTEFINQYESFNLLESKSAS